MSRPLSPTLLAINLLLLTGLCLPLPAQPSGQAPALSPEKRVEQLLSDVYTTESGLPSNSMRAILHGQLGYLWLATANGLSRFDGRVFVNYTKSEVPELRNNDLSSLTEDTDGRLWIGTLGGGVTCWDRGRFTNYGKAQGLRNEMVNAVVYDATARLLWVGTNQGLFRLVNGKFDQRDVPADLQRAEISALRLDSSGRLWVGTKLQGLYSLIGSGIRLHLQQANGLGSNYVRNIWPGNGEQMWIGTNGGGLVQMDGPNAVRRIDEAAGLSSDYVHDVVVDAAGVVWMATPAGVNRLLPDGRIEVYNTAAGLSYNTVMCLALDREGSLWIGTSRGGLNRLRDGLFITYNQASGLFDNTVHGVLPDRTQPGNYWIATDDGVNRLENGRIVPAPGLNAIRGNRVRSVYLDRDNRLWISTYGGLFRQDRGGLRRFGAANGLASDLNRLVFEDSRGNTWIGTRSGLSRLAGRDSFVNYKSSSVEALANGVIHYIYEDRGGNLWIGTDGNGLVRMPAGDVNQARVFTIADGLGSDVVYKMLEDAEGNLWIGTNGGLTRYRDGKFATVSTDNGLKSNSIFQIIPDGQDQYWLTTDMGATVVARKELLAAAADPARRVNIRVFTRADGLPTNEATANGWAIRTPEGLMLIPTVQGLAIIPEKTDRKSSYQPPVVIERLQAIGADILPWGLNRVAIAPDQRRTLEIGFTCLTFFASDKVTFEYQLEGFDTDWKPARADRTATYTNLPEGTYQFKVRARTPDGHWLPHVASLSLVMQPFFYETWWFRILVVLLVVGTGVGIYRWRVREYRRREAQLQRLVDERTTDLREEKGRTDAANHELEQRNTLLSETLENLKLTQNQLVHSEKMAALGVLLAGVAHEINTPLAAINAAGGSLYKTLAPTLHQLPKVLRNLDPATEAGFFALLDRSLTFSGSLTSREERQYRKQVAEVLQREHVDHGESIAPQLVKIGIHDHLDDFLPLLRHPQCAELLELVAAIGRLRLNVDNITLAVSKTQKIVYALKSYTHKQADEEPVEADIPETLDTVLTIYHNQLKSGIEVERHFPDHPRPIYCYPDELNQVWTNIIHNAIQAMQGQGKLVLEVEDHGREIWVRITDNGPGIPLDVMPNIFKAFYTTKAKGEGSGLGLDIVKRIVDKHNGQIDVTSVPGRTSFTVKLPTTLRPTINVAAAMTAVSPN